MDYLYIEVVKLSPNQSKDRVVTSVCGIINQSFYKLFHQKFVHDSISRIISMERRGLMEGLTTYFVNFV